MQDTWPQRLQQRGGYYGWVVWAVATLGILATAPAQAFTISLFIDRFIAEFDLDRTTVSSLFSAGTLTAAFTLTWIGGRIDRYGNRRVGLVVGALYALTLAAFSLVTGPLTLLLGFVALRTFGQGAMFLTHNTVVAQWFQRRRGRVLSVSMLLFALFQSFYIPRLSALLEASADWRGLWLLFGAGMGLLIVPLIWLLTRDRPEDYGLHPDNLTDAEDAEQSAAEAPSWTLRQAMGTAIFWVFLMGRIVSPGWGSGLIFHQVSLFESLGHSAQTAADVYGMVAFLTAWIALLTGVLVDRFPPGHVMSVQLVGLIAALLLATFMTQHWALLLYAGAFGVLMGSAGVFDSAVWANLFGRGHQGSIRGFVSTALVASTAAGPVMFGLSFDLTGSYTPILLIGAVVAVLPMLLAPLVPLPKPLPPEPLVVQGVSKP